MEIPVQVNASEINAAVTKAILDSAIGKKLEELVKAALENLTGWDSPIKKAVQELIQQEIMRAVREDHAEKIKKAVAAALTEKAIQDIWTASWESLMGRMQR